MKPFNLYENVCVKYYNQRIYVVHSVFLILWMTGVCFGYELKCPEASQWRIRATSLCPDPSKYYCLDDAAKKRYLGNRLMKGVSENCTKVDVESPGKKIVIRGQFDAAYCDADRYQPIKYFTNVSGECLFRKSTCSGEGQITHTDKNPVEDLTCRCDHTKGYTFTTAPKNHCFCVPSVEDCSCNKKPCNSSTIGLSQDYQCLSSISSIITQNCSIVEGSDKEDAHIPSTSKLPGFIDTTQPYAAKFRRTSGIFATSILSLILVIFVVLFLIYKISTDDDLYITETGSEVQRTYAHNDEHVGLHNAEIESDRKSVFGDKRWLDDLDLLESVANCKLSQNEYADCGLWDFAGQKEFYATHQAIITSNSIFLLVADISKDVNTDVDTSMLQRQFDSIGECIDFWFDSIHCYANGATEQRQSTLEPRIILIGTGTDKINKKNLESGIQEWQRNVMDLLKDPEKGRHLETFHYISNKESPESVIDDLRQKIFNNAKTLSVWRKSTPQVWIRLETKLNFLRKSNLNIINFVDICLIASKCSLTSDEELIMFLNEQNEIGSVIFFEDISDYIILNPKWLVDAFRCVVSDKIEKHIENSLDWNILKESGKLSRELMLKLFQKVPELQFKTYDDHVLKVMEKLDIIIKPKINENLDEEMSYYIPAKVVSNSTIEDIKTSFGLNNPNSKSSPWLILEFTFLPFAFSNHVFFDYIRKYDVCKDRNNRMAFYHGIGVFYIDKTKLYQKLVVCFSRNIIALQIWDLDENMGIVCKHIYDQLESTVHNMQQRYKMKLEYELKVKCADGNYKNKQGRLKVTDSFNTTNGKFYCEEHNEFHLSQTISSTWLEGRIIQPTETLETFENITSNEGLRYELQKTIDTGKARLYDMVINHDGILICSDGECNQLVTYTMTGERQLTMKLSGNPYSLAVIDNNTVAVTIPNEGKVDIINLKQKQTIREISIDTWCTDITFIQNQLYVFTKQTLKVVHMNGLVLESIRLPGFTSDDCCSSREGNIYCTDYNKLYCIDIKANLLFSFSTKDTIHPRGVTVDDENNILLACSHSNSVHRVASDGSKSQEIIADLPKSYWSPFICFDMKTKSIVIGRENKVFIYERCDQLYRR